jgi:hypothetical protein
LKLVSVAPPSGVKTVVGTDRFGTISFRTFYTSSKVTQFLPLEQKPMIVHGDPRIPSIVSSSAKLTSPRSMALGGDHSEPGTPKSRPDSPVSEEEERPATTTEIIPPDQPFPSYEFSIELMKLQLARVVRILKYVKGLKTVSYFLHWRDPRWTLFVYVWLSWVALVEPWSFLLFYYVLLGKFMLEAHPSYGEFVTEVTDWMNCAKTRLAGMLTVEGIFARKKHKLGRRTHSVLGLDKPSVLGESGGDGPVEFRVYECQRRRIATARQILTTMVKTPASLAAAAAKPFIPSRDSDSDDPGTPKSAGSNLVDSVQEAARDFQDLFMAFSGENLRAGSEAEWVGPNGVPLDESPATVMEGVKIKWSVNVSDGGGTDLNGWEYARHLPGLDVEGDKTILFDGKSVGWGSGSFLGELKLRKHWTRRRLWVGIPIRPAFESEEPVRLSEIIEGGSSDGSLEAAAAAAAAADKEGKGLFAKYKKLLQEGKKLQMAIFRGTSKIESVKNLWTWKVGWITSILFWVVQILLVLTLVLPPSVVLWLLLTLILLDQFTDLNQKNALMNPLMERIAIEIEFSTSVPEPWKPRLTLMLASYYTRLVDLTNEFSGTVVLNVLQHACDRLGMRRVRLSLADLQDDGAASGGPATVGMLLETIHERANNGNEDWWKQIKTTVHPKNLIKHHLVSDWEEFNPTSMFAHNN